MDGEQRVKKCVRVTNLRSKIDHVDGGEEIDTLAEDLHFGGVHPGGLEHVVKDMLFHAVGETGGDNEGQELLLVREAEFDDQLFCAVMLFEVGMRASTPVIVLGERQLVLVR